MDIATVQNQIAGSATEISFAADVEFNAVDDFDRVAGCAESSIVARKGHITGEVAVEIEQNVRARDIFVVQPTCSPTNENLMELCIIVDALKSNPAAGDLLRECGFSPARLLTRMYRGPNSFPGKPASLCAILGPEFG